MNRKVIVVFILGLISLAGVFVWKNQGTTANAGDEERIVLTRDTTTIRLTSSAMGVYSPQIVKVKAGTKVRVEADPNTLTGSMGTLIIDGLNLSKEITADSNILEFVADRPGQYRMHCANNMGNGTLIVE